MEERQLPCPEKRSLEALTKAQVGGFEPRAWMHAAAWQRSLLASGNSGPQLVYLKGGCSERRIAGYGESCNSEKLNLEVEGVGGSARKSQRREAIPPARQTS